MSGVSAYELDKYPSLMVSYFNRRAVFGAGWKSPPAVKEALALFVLPAAREPLGRFGVIPKPTV